jgi:hypothetical protein
MQLLQDIVRSKDGLRMFDGGPFDAPNQVFPRIRRLELSEINCDCHNPMDPFSYYCN